MPPLGTVTKGSRAVLKLHEIIIQDLEEITAEQVSWDKLRGKTVLITGASGLIASYLVYTLLYLNDTRGMDIQVLALVRNREKAETQFGEIIRRQDFVLLVQDVCESIAYDGEIDYIIHAASQASPRYFLSDPVGTIRANTIGTQNMLELAVKKQAQGFLYLSTREIYGAPLAGQDRIAEQDYGTLDPVQIRSCYPESKRMSETLCAAYRHQYGIATRTARIAHTYGPDQVMDNGRVWGDFISNIVRGENIILKSQGTMELAFTYISDMVYGLLLILLDGEELAYNLSNTTEIVTVRELAERLVSLYPDKQLKVVMDIPADTRAYLANRVAPLDCTKAEQLGWVPRVGLTEGFRRAIAYQESR